MLKETFNVKGVEYTFYKGTFKWDIPKSWEQIDIILVDELSSRYNSGLVHIYEVKSRGKITYRYSVYRDGSFNPLCGKCEISKK